MYSTNSTKYCGLTPMQKPKGEYYRVKLYKCIDPSMTIIGIGYDKKMASRVVFDIDDYILEKVNHNENPDIDEIKAIIEKAKAPIGLQIVKKDSLIALWDNYCNHNGNVLKRWSETYMRTHIQTVTSLLKKCPIQNISEDKEIIEWFLNDPKRSIKTSKDRLELVVACIEFNSIQGTIDRKWGLRYKDLLSQIKPPKKETTDNENDIDIFTEEEIDTILKGFSTGYFSKHPKLVKQYYFYIKFCYLTGCRPSEAVALKWNNVTNNTIKFCEIETIASGKRVKANRTKTESYRDFPINDEIRELLNSIPKRSDYVFVRDNGTPIHQHTFNNVWIRALDKMGIRYRVPYQLRHTFISWHINNGMDIAKIADICGNSVEICESHYYKIDKDKIYLSSRK